MHKKILRKHKRIFDEIERKADCDDYIQAQDGAKKIRRADGVGQAETEFAGV